jgi:hypothetical protein
MRPKKGWTGSFLRVTPESNSNAFTHTFKADRVLEPACQWPLRCPYPAHLHLGGLGGEGCDVSCAAYYLHMGVVKAPLCNCHQPHMVLRDVLEWKYTGNTRHPIENPLMTMMLLVQAFSNPGEIVLDPFVGSGTTAVATKQLGRRYIGIDIEPVYAQQAQERVRCEGRAA